MKKVLLLSLAMGTCSSIHKSKMPLVPSPRKHKSANGNEGENPEQVVASGFTSKTSEFGSKEEMFFDSKVWLDSDCEDDFLSVNGDFTPSRGSSPNNQRSFSFNNFPDPDFEPSQTVRKKLAVLFRETSQLNASGRKVETNYTTHGLFSRAETDRSWNESNSTSSCKSSRSRSPDIKKNQKADNKAGQCCLLRPFRDIKRTRSQNSVA